MCVLLAICSKNVQPEDDPIGSKHVAVRMCYMVVVYSLFCDLHLFNRLLAAGCVHPKHVAGIFKIRSCVVMQNEHVSVCLCVIKSECIAHCLRNTALSSYIKHIFLLCPQLQEGMEKQCLHPLAARPVKVMVSAAKEHQNLTPQLGQGVQKNG